MVKFSETRLRTVDGFITIAEAKIDWLRINPIFSVYSKDAELGCISNGKVVEVIDESERAYLEMIASNFDAVMKQ